MPIDLISTTTRSMGLSKNNGNNSNQENRPIGLQARPQPDLTNLENLKQQISLNPAPAVGASEIDLIKSNLINLDQHLPAANGGGGADPNPVKKLTRLTFSKYATNVANNQQNNVGDENATAKNLIDLDLHQKQQKLKAQNPTEPPVKPQYKLLQQLNKDKDNDNNIKQQQTLKSKQHSLIPKPSLIPLPVDKIQQQQHLHQLQPEPILDIDKSDSRDAMYLVNDVAKDIYEYMFQLEIDQAIREDYLKDQKILTPKVRARLVNWCIDIHQTLRLLPETLYMTIGIIDRYFALVQVKQQSTVQLVAVGATLIASKYEEIYPPDVGDLIHLTQNAYSRKDVFKIEINILETLRFDLGKPIPPVFLRRFSRANSSDSKTHSIAKYLMELSLCEYDCCHWKPSLLAAAALYISVHLVHQDIAPPPTAAASTITNNALTTTSSSIRRFGSTLTSQLSMNSNSNNNINNNNNSSSTNGSSNNNSDRWNRTLVHYSHYSKKDLQEPAAALCKILKKSQKNPLSYNVVKKYQSNLPKWTELKSTRVDYLMKS